MKKTVIALSLISALMIAGEASVTVNAAPLPQKQTLCPVQGDPINKNLYEDHDGKRIYVCCKGCLPKVNQDPAKYIHQLEQQGITLDKAATYTEHPAPAPAQGYAHGAHGGCCSQ